MRYGSERSGRLGSGTVCLGEVRCDRDWPGQVWSDPVW